MKIKIITLILFFLLAPYSYAQSPTTNENIRDRVQEKLNSSSKIPSAYIGTVTDKAESTLQIDKFALAKQAGDSGEIEQVSTADETKFVSIGKTSKNIGFADIAIGDFIVAMGYKNGNGVLASKRILVIEPLKASTRKSYFGSILNVTRNTITINFTGSEKEFSFTRNSDLLQKTDGDDDEITSNDLNQDDKVIIVTTDDENVRTLFLLPSPVTTEQSESSE
jgi:hypothetical protein